MPSAKIQGEVSIQANESVKDYIARLISMYEQAQQQLSSFTALSKLARSERPQNPEFVFEGSRVQLFVEWADAQAFERQRVVDGWRSMLEARKTAELLTRDMFRRGENPELGNLHGDRAQLLDELLRALKVAFPNPTPTEARDEQ